MKFKNPIYILFSLLLVLTACTKDETPATNIDSADYLYFVSGKINGEDFIYGQREDDTKLEFQLIGGGLEEGATCVYYESVHDAKASYSTAIYPNFDEEDTKPSFGFYFDRFYSCNNPQEFNEMFPTEDYNFAMDDEPIGAMREMGLSYQPTVSGDGYFSSYSKDQSQSSFKITSSESDNTAYGSAQMIGGEFSVTLYPNDDSAESIQITNGRFKVRVSR